MRAAIPKVGSFHVDAVAPGLLLGAAAAGPHEPDIVGVGDADLADAADDVLGDVTVAAAGLACEIVAKPVSQSGLSRTVVAI